MICELWALIACYSEEEEATTLAPRCGQVRLKHVYETDDKSFETENGMIVKIESSRLQIWYKNGQRHREDGPAVIWADGSQWWKYGLIWLLREEWWNHGKRHRADGPAVIWADGYQEWWHHGIKVTSD